MGARGPGACCLGLDLPSQQGVDGVQPVVKVPVAARLEEEVNSVVTNSKIRPNTKKYSGFENVADTEYICFFEK